MCCCFKLNQHQRYGSHPIKKNIYTHYINTELAKLSSRKGTEEGYILRGPVCFYMLSFITERGRQWPVQEHLGIISKHIT